MPILFMALIALAIFLIMGAMVFYAAYAESHTPHKKEVPHSADAPANPRATGKAAGAD